MIRLSAQKEIVFVKLRDFFKPAPHLEPLKDQEEIQRQYKYWRWRIFYGMYIGYAFYYFTRKSLAFAMPGMVQDLNLPLSSVGMLGSILAIVYGASKFLSGVLSDRSNARYFMAIGLLLTGVFNIFFGCSSSFLFFAIFWGLNGLFQGWGGPACAKLLTHWYAQKERGTWWGIWNSSHSIGGAIIPLIIAFCLQLWGWRYAMCIPGVMCILGGLFLINRLRDTPQSLGLPAIEVYKGDAVEAKQEECSMSAKEVLVQYILKNKYVWVLAISYFFVYAIRQAINDWGAIFLMKEKQHSLLAASGSIFWFEVGGVCGSLLAGWSSDKFFQGRRCPVIVLCSFLVILAMGMLYFSPPGNLVLDYAILFTIGLLIFGPQLLVGMAAAELSNKHAVGAATGFTGWFAYLGAAFAGYPISKIAEVWGWSGFFVILSICGAVAMLLLLPLWGLSLRPAREDKRVVEEELTQA